MIKAYCATLGLLAASCTTAPNPAPAPATATAPQAKSFTPTIATEVITNGTWLLLDEPEKAEGTLAFTGDNASWMGLGKRTSAQLRVTSRRDNRVELTGNGTNFVALWSGPDAAWLWSESDTGRGWLLLRSRPVPSHLLGTWRVEPVIKGTPLPPTLDISVAEMAWKKGQQEERYRILGTYQWKNSVTLVGDRARGDNILSFQMLGPDAAVVFEPDEFHEFMVVYRGDKRPSWLESKPTMQPNESQGDQVL